MGTHLNIVIFFMMADNGSEKKGFTLTAEVVSFVRVTVRAVLEKKPEWR